MISTFQGYLMSRSCDNSTHCVWFPTDAPNLAENGRGWPAPAQFWPGHVTADIKKAGSLPHKIAKIRSQDNVRSTDVSSLNRSRSCAGCNRPSSQLTVWTSSQTSRGHTCPSSLLVVPHRSVTRSPSRPELEAMSRPPSEQVAWSTPQGQQIRLRFGGFPPTLHAL